MKAKLENTRLYRVWKRFIYHGDTEDIPAHVKASWLRCKEKGLDPELQPKPIRLPEEELALALERHRPFLQAIEAHYPEIETHMGGFPFAGVLLSGDGYVLHIFGEKQMLNYLYDSGIEVGISSREEVIGTAAPALSLEEKRLALVDGEEHYLRPFHWASCVSVPFIDGAKNLLGVFDVTCHREYKDRLLSLVPLLLEIAHSVHFECRVKDLALRDQDLLGSFYHSLFSRADVALILLDREGRILDLNLNAQRLLGRQVAQVRQRHLQTVLKGKIPFPASQGSVGYVEDFPTADRCFFETAPIFDASGKEVAFLLRLEEYKWPKRARTMEKDDRDSFSCIIGHSRPIRQLIERAKRAARNDSTILLEGETGTGKELFARAIHSESPYREGPFVVVNCAAIPRELVESELFGYERGAFTGALREGQQGKFELANRGTLFLDEVQAMDTAVQQKVLRAVENKEVLRIGGRRPIPLKIRLIAASSTDLEREVKEGRFLPALFYRLNVVRLVLPPLRERREDIADLVEFFIEEMKRKFALELKGVAPEALEVLMHYAWPGNVRELRNCIEAACNFCKGPYITKADLPESVLSFRDEADRTFDGLIRGALLQSLREHGSARKAASSLKIPLSTFYRKLKRLGISPPSRDSHI